MYLLKMFKMIVKLVSNMKYLSFRCFYNVAFENHRVLRIKFETLKLWCEYEIVVNAQKA